MKMDWHDYELYVPVTRGLHSEMSRPDARAEYENLMANRPGRIAMLGALVAHDGVRLDGSDDSVQALNEWFVENVEEDTIARGLISGRWVSVAIDVSLYLGDLLIARHPNLRWELYTWGGKRADGYHQAVLMGFASEDPQWHTNLAIEPIVLAVGNAAIMGDKSSSRFARLVQATSIRA